MSVILKKIKEDLKSAMLGEIKIRKEGPADGDFIVSQQSLLEKYICQKEVSRAIISMFPEIGTKPGKATDDDTIKLLKKYISMEKTRQLYIDKHITEKDVEGLNASQLNTLVISKFNELGEKLTSPKIQIAKQYLPGQASEEEVIAWIKENIDLSQFKNKMQAMKPIMNQFRGMDGNFIRKILEKLKG